MNRSVKILGVVMLVVFAVSIALSAGIGALTDAFHATPMIEINGTPLDAVELSFGDGLLAIFGVLLALAIVAIVVPFAVLLPLLLVALLVGGVLLVALLAVGGVLALVCSPLLLLVGAAWLIWRLARRSGSSATGASKAGATIVG